MADEFMMNWGEKQADGAIPEEITYDDMVKKIDEMKKKRVLGRGFGQNVIREFRDLDEDNDGIVSKANVQNYYDKMFGLAQIWRK